MKVVIPHFTPPQEEKLTAIQEQDITERILEHGSGAQTLPCITKTKTGFIRRVREAATH